MSQCLTAAPGDRRIVPHESSHGFSFGDWKGKSFLWADKPGDRLVMQGLPRHFGILVFHWVSRSLGFGKVKCWIVGLENDAVILDGYRNTYVNGPV